MSTDDTVSRVHALEVQMKQMRLQNGRVEDKVDQALEKLNQLIGERKGVKYIIGLGLTGAGIVVGFLTRHWMATK